MGLFKDQIQSLAEPLNKGDAIKEEAPNALRELVGRMYTVPRKIRNDLDLALNKASANAKLMGKHDNNGGGRGIRTLDTVARIHAFQACAFSHSATPPMVGNYIIIMNN